MSDDSLYLARVEPNHDLFSPTLSPKQGLADAPGGRNVSGAPPVGSAPSALSTVACIDVAVLARAR